MKAGVVDPEFRAAGVGSCPGSRASLRLLFVVDCPILGRWCRWRPPGPAVAYWPKACAYLDLPMSSLRVLHTGAVPVAISFQIRRVIFIQTLTVPRHCRQRTPARRAYEGDSQGQTLPADAGSRS